MIKTETPLNTLQNLAAPSLHHLTLDYSPEDQHTESREDFGSNQLTWMNLIFFASLKKSSFPNSKLQAVIIHFNPSGIPRFCHYSSDGVWPWEYIEQAAETVREFELVLRYYREPSGPRRIVREAKEERKRDRGGCITDHFQQK